MATLYSQQASAGVSPKGLRVGLVAVASTYSLAASLSTGDVIQMVKVPAGATVVNIIFKSYTSGAGNGSVRIGDGVNTTRYIQDYAVSVSASPVFLNNPAWRPYEYSADDTIDVLVSASATWSGTGGGFDLVAIYSMDVEPYTTP